MRALWLIVALAGAGCLRDTLYKCTSNDQCGAGTCEGTGFCSFPDAECAGGQRYGESAGSLSGTCVDGMQPGEDGGVDTMPDGGPTACPSTYTMLAGVADRAYRVLTTPAAWSTQEAACAADSSNTYLAIPGDQTELTAIIDAAGVARIWVGIEDPNANDMYATVAGDAFPADSPLWDSGEPDDNAFQGQPGNANCVAAVMNNGKLATDRCTSTYAAVCECVP